MGHLALVGVNLVTAWKSMMKTVLSIFLTALFASPAFGSGAVELTPANFDAKMSGKNAFVKFLAPW